MERAVEAHQHKADILNDMDLPFAASEETIWDLKDHAYNDDSMGHDIALEKIAAMANKYCQTSWASQIMMKHMGEAE